ncbi:carbohydrate esterase family 4 protein [Mycena filopes]|nr:carbohydrate esterase family 4 protein [Mycena filopes]
MLFSLLLVLTTAVAACAGAGAIPRNAAPLATIYKSCKVKGDIALTFVRCSLVLSLAFCITITRNTQDDGPYIYLCDISDTLVAAGAHATFFFIVCIYDEVVQQRVKYAHEHGHLIGSHTWSHTDLTTLNSNQIHNEMWLVEQALERIIGVSPAFMRPPYGLWNNQVLEVSRVRNQSVVLWDFDSGDSTGSAVAQSEALYADIAKTHPNTLLAVNHETEGSHQLLPYAIKELQGAGYKLVTLDKCLGLPAYHSVRAPSKPDVRIVQSGLVTRENSTTALAEHLGVLNESPTLFS